MSILPNLGWFEAIAFASKQILIEGICGVESGITTFEKVLLDVSRILRIPRAPRVNLLNEVYEALRTQQQNKQIIILSAYKENDTLVLDFKVYVNKMEAVLHDSEYVLITNNTARYLEKNTRITIKNCPMGD